jgi:hypothetical protein
MGEKIYIGALQNFGVPGSPFGARTAVVLAANTSGQPAKSGWYLVETDAGSIVRYTYNSGTTFVTLLAASSVGIVWFDGYAVELRGVAGGTVQISAVLGAG